MKESLKEKILRLANNPYVQGMGSIADVFGPTVSYEPKTLRDDMQALREDWLTIGNDMRVAFDMQRREVANGR